MKETNNPRTKPKIDKGQVEKQRLVTIYDNFLKVNPSIIQMREGWRSQEPKTPMELSSQNPKLASSLFG